MTNGVDHLAEIADIDRRLGALHKQHKVAMATLDWERVTLIQQQIAELQSRVEQIRAGSPT